MEELRERQLHGDASEIHGSAPGGIILTDSAAAAAQFFHAPITGHSSGSRPVWGTFRYLGQESWIKLMDKQMEEKTGKKTQLEANYKKKKKKIIKKIFL